MGAEEVARFFSSLALHGHVSASTQNQALSAILLPYREVLHQDLPWLDGIVRAKRSVRLPVVLTRDEVQAVLGHLRGTPLLMATLLCGAAGLRLPECARLRVKDVEFAANQIFKIYTHVLNRGPAAVRSPADRLSVPGLPASEMGCSRCSVCSNRQTCRLRVRRMGGKSHDGR